MVSTPSRGLSPCAVPGLLLTLLVAAHAQAQSPTPPRPDPLDAKAQVPVVRYESSFTQFRRLGDDKPVAWRDANDTVARIGGWRVYAREAQQPDTAAPEKPATPPQAPSRASTPVPAPAAQPMPARPSGHKH